MSDAARGHVIGIPWNLVYAPADRAEVIITYDLHDYLTLERTAVEESDDQVKVTVYGRLDPPQGGWTALGHPHTTE